jgi:hypothetical protein
LWCSGIAAQKALLSVAAVLNGLKLQASAVFSFTLAHVVRICLCEGDLLYFPPIGCGNLMRLYFMCLLVLLVSVLVAAITESLKV